MENFAAPVGKACVPREAGAARKNTSPILPFLAFASVSGARRPAPPGCARTVAVAVDDRSAQPRDMPDPYRKGLERHVKRGFRQVRDWRRRRTLRTFCTMRLGVGFVRRLMLSSFVEASPRTILSPTDSVTWTCNMDPVALALFEP